MNKSSTRHLIKLCSGYFFFYVITGFMVKYFLHSGMGDIQYLVYSTAGSSIICFGFIFWNKWYKFKVRTKELLFIIPSGICTAIIIPTTTLLYTFPASILIIIALMRASVIIVSRLVDEVQIRQGLLKKRVYAEENIAVLFAIIAISINVFFLKSGIFSINKSNAPVLIIFSCNILAYGLRIYLMNYYKNKLSTPARYHPEKFFVIEHFTNVSVMILFCVVVLCLQKSFNWQVKPVLDFQQALIAPHPRWLSAMCAGTAFGFVAYFSFAILMFPGRTATFVGLINRLTSLIAGTASTIVFYMLCGGTAPGPAEWLTLIFMVISVYFLGKSERRRSQELLSADYI